MNHVVTAILGIAFISLLAYLEVKREEKVSQRVLTDNQDESFRSKKTKIRLSRHRH